MRSPRFLVATSVVAAMLGCKPAAADDVSVADAGNFHLGGYSSVGVQIHSDGKAEAALNEVSLFLNWDSHDRWRIFSELEVEKPLTWEQGHSVSDEYFYFDVERLYVDYSLSGKLNLRAGHFLTPIGRWNLIHAAPLVWTTSRPAATARLFPLGFNGVMVYGATPWNDAAIEYSAYIETLRDQTDDPGEIQYKDTRGLRLAYTGAFEAGLNYSEFQEETPGNPHYRMLGLDFLKVVNGWEFSGEWYTRYESHDGDNSGGGYLQGVAPLGNRWYAVARLESMHRPDEETTDRWVLGATWRWKSDQVFKLEFVGGHDAYPDDTPRGFAASYSILF